MKSAPSSNSPLLNSKNNNNNDNNNDNNNNNNNNDNNNDNNNNNNNNIYPGNPLALAVFSGALQIII